MRRLIPLVLLLLCWSPLSACKRGSGLAHRTESLQKGFENCRPGQENCTYVKLTYPVFTQGPSSEGLAAINRQVMEFIISPTGDKRSADLDSFLREFFADYQTFRKEFPQAPQVWTVDRRVDILVEDAKILSLSMQDDQYLGGAHPNSFHTLLSLNSVTGARFALSDLLKPGYEAALNELGEKKFREVRQIPARQTLEQAGFNFAGGIFKLNENFAAGAKGLSFVFNAYEIAPYVYGPTELTVDYSDLKNWLKPDGPLQGLAQ